VGKKQGEDTPNFSCGVQAASTKGKIWVGQTGGMWYNSRNTVVKNATVLLGNRQKFFENI
jgi:hypothetical protein